MKYYHQVTVNCLSLCQILHNLVIIGDNEILPSGHSELSFIVSDSSQSCNNR